MPHAILDSFPAFFADPVTGLTPKTERECTALLWRFHQNRAINWSAVNLYSHSLEHTGRTAISLFERDSSICLEYPLFSTDRFGGDQWGDMRADLLLFSAKMNRIALFECKLSCRFTSGGIKPRTGQLARLATFLRHCKAHERTLVLICPPVTDPESPYALALRNALKYAAPQDRLEGYLIFWQEIANALVEQAV